MDWYLIRLYWRITMSNKNKKLLPLTPEQNAIQEKKLEHLDDVEYPNYNEELKINKVYFTHDIPIYLNYLNKVDTEHYELTIKGMFLFIKDKNKNYTHLVPLANVSTIEAYYDQS